MFIEFILKNFFIRIENSLKVCVFIIFFIIYLCVLINLYVLNVLIELL